MSPDASSSPDVFWQDHVLRTSESTDAVVRVVRASDGIDSIKNILQNADRSRLRVVHLEVGREEDCLQSALAKDPQYALKYAYEHPGAPKLPDSSLRPIADRDAALAKEEGVLRWLMEEAFPANPGSRFVSNVELKKTITPPASFSVQIASLRTALAGMLEKWGNDTFLPSYLVVDGQYLSLADLFQVMTDTLAEFDRSGRLPSSTTVVEVYGPIRTVTGHGPNAGEVSVASIAHAAAGLAEGLHDASPGPVPKNAIPTMVTVDRIQMNAAQFLRVMATALVNPDLDAKLRVKMTYMFAGPAALIPKSRPYTDFGGMWTVKPAVLAVNLPEPSVDARQAR